MDGIAAAAVILWGASGGVAITTWDSKFPTFFDHWWAFPLLYVIALLGPLNIIAYAAVSWVARP